MCWGPESGVTAKCLARRKPPNVSPFDPKIVKMTEYVQLSTTTSTANEAEAIATALVELRLAACVQIVPQVRSIYRWQGKIEQADEWLCLVKTHRSLLPQVEAAVGRRHSYECPEIVVVAIETGSSAYLKWLGEQIELK